MISLILAMSLGWKFFLCGFVIFFIYFWITDSRKHKTKQPETPKFNYDDAFKEHELKMRQKAEAEAKRQKDSQPKESSISESYLKRIDNENDSFDEDDEDDSFDEDDIFETYVAGVNRHNKPRDIGCHVAITMPEPSNRYNPEAVMILDTTGRKLGYVPDHLLDEYHQQFGNGTYACLVQIYPGESTPLYGRLFVFPPISEESIKLNICRQALWIIERYGARYFPRGMSFTDADTPTTKEGMIKELKEYIEENSKTK